MEYLRRRPLAVAAILSILIAVACWLVYSPLYEEDSTTYLLLARAIRQGAFFTQDTGGRTPLFPLFLAMLGGDGRAVFEGNLVLGVLTSLLLFRIFSIVTDSEALATAVAVIFMVNPSTLHFERTVLTEMPACFLVSLGTLFAVEACNAREHLARRTGLSSLAFSLAALTRPVFQFLPLVSLAALFGRGQEPRLKRRCVSKVIVAVLAPFAALVMGWALLNYARFGWFTLSTFTGYHLTNQTGPFMRESPPQYAKIAAIYSRYEEAHVRETGIRANAVWGARKEMERATGMNEVQLSRLLAGISCRLILSHPVGYAENAEYSFKRFWRPPLYDRCCNVGDFRKGLREVHAGRVSWFERFYAYLYLPFLLAYAFSLGAPLILEKWRSLLWTPGLRVLHAVILYTAVISSLSEYGENSRFKFPVEGLVIGVALTVFYGFAKTLPVRAGRRRKLAGVPAFACTANRIP